MNKEYKTVDEMIDYLRENKRIIVSDEYRKVFEERSYISLINPYKEFFSYGRNEKGEHIYPVDTDFEKIMTLVKIDDIFCEILYRFIGTFEKKFKNILFNEICLKYVDECDEKECISYVCEIEKFLATGCYEDLPRFCLNYRYTATKKNGYVLDNFQEERRKALLVHIKEIGTGKSEDGSLVDISNKLILHYINIQNIVPLWVVPNALTLGELTALYTMLDSFSQRRIIMKMYSIEELAKVDFKKIVSFCGQLEMIRRMRNIVNHYEPIFPLFINDLKNTKKIKSSQISAVMDLLESNYNESSFSEFTLKEIDTERNAYNSKSLKIFEYINEVIHKQNKRQAP